MFVRSPRKVSAAPFAAMLLAIATLAGCSSDPAGGGNTAGGAANTATKPATNAPAAGPGGMPGNMPAPLGMEDSIEGTVVGVLCLEKNPAMTGAEMKACAEASMKEFGALAVLGNDGVLYVNDEQADVRKNNAQLEFFISEVVTVQGQLIGDATKAKVGQIPVKQFRMKLVRRKAAKPAASNQAAGK